MRSKVSENLVWKCGGTLVPGGIRSMKTVRAPLLRVVDSSRRKRREFQRRSVDMMLLRFDNEGGLWTIVAQCGYVVEMKLLDLDLDLD